MQKIPFSRSFAAALAAALLAAVAATADAQQPRKGGNVVVAMQGHPPTLDPQFTGSGETRNVVTHIYEGLVALDETSTPIPDLAERYSYSADATSVTFVLRKGVRFHNGKEMKATDVKASLERYARVSPNRTLLAPMESVTVVDDYTVAMKLKRPAPTLVEEMASPATVVGIMPAEDGETAGGKNSNVGTGPYRLVNWVADSHITLARFDAYVPNPNYEQRNGYGGRKTPYFDTVTFRIVPEAGARMAGLETGEFHVVEQVPSETAANLAKNSNVRVHDMMPWWMLFGYMNTAQAPTDDHKVRQAIQAAVNQEEVMAIATQGFFRLNHALQYPESRWYPGEANKAVYGQKNIAKAKQLLAESGKAGADIAIVASSDFEECKNAAVVLSEQLRAAGLRPRLQTVNHPTYMATRGKREGWNITVCGNGIEPFLGAYAYSRLLHGKTNAMHADDPAMAAAWEEILQKTTFAERKAGWAKLEDRIHQQAYLIKLGDAGIKQATRANVENFKPFRSPRMWDVWFR